MTWLARFRMQCAGRGDADALDIELTIDDLSFMPTKGMMLGVFPSGDHLLVDEVFWHIDQPHAIEVWLDDGLDDADLRPYSYWKKQGWRKA